MRPKSTKPVLDHTQSPASSLEEDKVTTDIPVDETVQSLVGSDVAYESTQNNKPNKVNL